MQYPYRRSAYIFYPDNPPVMFAGLPCFRAVAVMDGDSADIYFNTEFGVDFCQVAEIRGFALHYSTMINGMNVIYQAVRFRPGNFPSDMFDLSKRRIIPSTLPRELILDQRPQAFIGKLAALVSGTTLDGKKISSEYLSGRVVALNFWFINCQPCRMEIPALNRLAARYHGREDVVFVAVALDNARQVNKFVQKMPFAYEVLPDGAALATRHRVRSYPTNMVIDRNGRIVECIIGYGRDVEQRLDEAIRNVLAGA